jgi:two-component system cell cycle response regulator
MSKVLVVDDDAHFRGIIERLILRSYTYTVRTASTEEEAWEELDNIPYDLVVLDLFIDGKKSWDTLRRIRKLPSGPPVIMVTCEDTRENQEYAMSLGAVDFISKPIDFGRFKTTVDDALAWRTRDLRSVLDDIAADKSGGVEEMRILVIDSDKENREFLKSALDHRGCMTFEAENSETALVSLQMEMFDAVLARVRESDTNAVEALKKVREVETSSLRMPVIAVTDGGAEAILSALRTGADDYISLPIDPKILAGKVEAHVRLRREYDRRLERVISLCVTDALTGSYNQVYFRNRLKEEFDRSLRYGRNLSLALIGLDHLEKVRTALGTPATDRILSDISDVIRKSIRSSDIVARFEQDHFALLMPEATADKILKKAAAIRIQVEEKAAYLDGKKTDIVCSVGLASLSVASAAGGPTESVKSSEDLLGMANMALSRARMAGKSRVEVFGG